METGLSRIREIFQLSELPPGQYSPLTLAFLGDAVYEMVIRSIVVTGRNQAVSKFHRETIHLVNAGVQARMAKTLREVFTEEEKAVYRRGRNAKAATSAKNASIGEYRSATGFEAVLGYLYLQEKYERIYELIRLSLPETVPEK